jgi:nicotinamide-nucleotide amidase
MRAEILAVGDELLLGDIVNGNAAWLGGRLAEAGVEVTRSVVVGDDVTVIGGAIAEALSRADALVITGGLGPTQDDLTREGLAAAAGVDLDRDPDLEKALRERFTAVRRDVPEMNYKQADLPSGASPLPNVRGTAPGLRMPLLGGIAYALPGVPHEMRAMFDDEVLPDLLARAGRPAVIVSRVIRTAGMWESAVASALSDQVARLETEGRIRVAFLAGGGQTRVKLTVAGATREEALATLAPEVEEAVEALGPGVYGYDNETLESAVAALLRTKGETVAVAESLTGGMLGGRLSDAGGASDVYLGGITAYATHLKAALLGVDRDVLVAEGAVSDGTAEQMAVGARERLGATYGLSLTGVAGPSEQEGKPVGTVHVGLAFEGGSLTRQLRLPGDRELIRTYACVSALDLLRRHLVGALERSDRGSHR